MVVYFFLNIFPGVFVLYFLFSISVNQTLGYSHYQKTTFAYNATLLNQSSIIPLKLISFGCCRIYMYLNVLQNHVQTWVYFKTTCTGTGLQKQTIFFKIMFVLCKVYFWIIFLSLIQPSISPQHIPTKQQKRSTDK